MALLIWRCFARSGAEHGSSSTHTTGPSNTFPSPLKHTASVTRFAHFVLIARPSPCVADAQGPVALITDYGEVVREKHQILDAKNKHGDKVEVVQVEKSVVSYATWTVIIPKGETEGLDVNDSHMGDQYEMGAFRAPYFSGKKQVIDKF